LGEVREKRLPNPAAAKFGANVEILEVKAVLSKPG
jgi:hypothetical protein